MEPDILASLFADLERLRQENRCPFPMPEAIRMINELHIEHLDFLGDVIGFVSAISGFASWGTRIRDEWTRAKKDEVIRIITPSFFERYPQYKVVQIAMQEGSYQEVKIELERSEAVQKLILAILHAEPAK